MIVSNDIHSSYMKNPIDTVFITTFYIVLNVINYFNSKTNLVEQSSFILLKDINMIWTTILFVGKYKNTNSDLNTRNNYINLELHSNNLLRNRT